MFRYAFSIKIVEGQQCTSWILTRARISWNLKARWKQWNTRSADLVEHTLVGKFSRQACRSILVVSHLPQYIDNMYIVCLGSRSHISVIENKIGCVYTRLSRATNGARCLYPGLFYHRIIQGEETSIRQHIRLQFTKKNWWNSTFGAYFCWMLILGHFGPCKYWNVVLETDWESQLNRPCEKWSSIT
jgi:hypothetical protein